MGNLMKEVRAWLDEAEDFIKFLREQNDPQKEIQEKIEVKSTFFFYLVNNKTTLSGKDKFIQAIMRIDWKRSPKRGSCVF